MSEPDLSELNFDKKKKKKKTIKLDDEMESLELRKSKILRLYAPLSLEVLCYALLFYW